MKIEKAKHTLAKLRITLGLRQKEMADLLGVSLATIQSIESGRLRLSKQLAVRAEFETGVNAHWLFANDISKPVRSFLGDATCWQRDERAGRMVMVDGDGKIIAHREGLMPHDEFYRKVFETGRARGGLEEAWRGFPSIQVFWAEVIRLIGVAESAVNKGRGRLLLFKLAYMVGELQSEFGLDEKLITNLGRAAGCLVGGYVPRKPKLVLEIQPLSKAVSAMLSRKAKSK
jgi:transcriptional regulator with XRE-family HTH domain